MECERAHSPGESPSYAAKFTVFHRVPEYEAMHCPAVHHSEEFDKRWAIYVVSRVVISADLPGVWVPLPSSCDDAD